MCFSTLYFRIVRSSIIAKLVENRTFYNSAFVFRSGRVVQIVSGVVVRIATEKGETGESEPKKTYRRFIPKRRCGEIGEESVSRNGAGWSSLLALRKLFGDHILRRRPLGATPKARKLRQRPVRFKVYDRACFDEPEFRGVYSGRPGNLRLLSEKQDDNDGGASKYVAALRDVRCSVRAE